MFYRNLYTKALTFFWVSVLYASIRSELGYLYGKCTKCCGTCAWSTEFYDSSRNAYRNNDLRIKMLHLLLRTMPCLDHCRAWTVLVKTYKNISGGG